jgi:hypothetical protein
MKNQNKNYLSLAEQGKAKAWDKAVIFKEKETEKLQMVVYYANKPFYYWNVKDAFDVADLKLTLACMLDVYNTASLNNRKAKNWLARNFVSFEASERVITYQRGGVLFPSMAGV